MNTSLMTILKKFLNANYNLGRATRPEPLPTGEVNLDYITHLVQQKKNTSSKTISSKELQRAFLTHLPGPYRKNPICGKS